MKPAYVRGAAILMALFLSSCVLGAGKGPITLSQSATEAFQRYKATAAPLNFLVSEDGRFAHFDYCRMGQQQCVSWTKYDLTEDCERRSRKKCYVFAQDGRVVWDGPVTFAGAGGTVAAAPSRYNPPKPGLRIETAGDHQQIAGVDGTMVVTTDARGRSHQWRAGIFLFDPESKTSPADLSAVWGAPQGQSLQFMVRVGDDVWRHTIRYVGRDHLSIDGRVYDIEKFERERLPVAPSRPTGHDRETLWYAPDVGFLVRRDVQHLSGPRDAREPFVATRIVAP